MPIKLRQACKKPSTKPIIAEPNKSILIPQNNQVPVALNKKIESAFTKNPLVDYELGYSVSAAAEASYRISFET